MESITINGKNFKPVTNSTMRHDIWVQGQIEKTGVMHIAIWEGELPEEYAMRVFRQAAMNGDVFLLLGGLLMPAELDPVSWTMEMAEATAKHLGNVTSDTDKAIVQMQINSALTSFFVTGLSSLMISPRSSQKTDAKPDPQEIGDALITEATGGQ
jgi:hypothetical protein